MRHHPTHHSKSALKIYSPVHFCWAIHSTTTLCLPSHSHAFYRTSCNFNSPCILVRSFCIFSDLYRQCLLSAPSSVYFLVFLSQWPMFLSLFRDAELRHRICLSHLKHSEVVFQAYKSFLLERSPIFPSQLG